MIGIFDSGFGGLSYAKEFNKQFPDYDFVYLGDQLRVPYGGRSREAICDYASQAVVYLWTKKNVDLVIIACNTASAEALRYVQQKIEPKYPGKKVLGILIPAVEESLKVFGPIGIVATKATVKIEAYIKEIHNREPNRMVYQVSAPLSVPFIEEGLGKSAEHRKILKKYLMPLKHANVKSLILGCTHYPHVSTVFKKIMGSQVEIINSAKSGVNKLKDYLNRHPEIDKKLTKKGKREFLTTDNSAYFDSQGSVFYGESIKSEKISLT